MSYKIIHTIPRWSWKAPRNGSEARAWFTKLENGDKEAKELWQWFRDESLKEFARVYDLLDIEFDSYNGESFYSDKMDRVIDIIKDKGLLQESQGTNIVDLEEYNMPPALITKNDGSTLYMTRDLAASIIQKRKLWLWKMYICSWFATKLTLPTIIQSFRTCWIWMG